MGMNPANHMVRSHQVGSATQLAESATSYKSFMDYWTQSAESLFDSGNREETGNEAMSKRLNQGQTMWPKSWAPASL